MLTLLVQTRQSSTHIELDWVELDACSKELSKPTVGEIETRRLWLEEKYACKALTDDTKVTAHPDPNSKFVVSGLTQVTICRAEIKIDPFLLFICDGVGQLQRDPNW